MSKLKQKQRASRTTPRKIVGTVSQATPMVQTDLSCHITMDILAEKLQQAHRISHLATQHPTVEYATIAHQLKLSSELLQNLILKLLLADAEGVGLKPIDTVHLARALKEIVGLHDRLAKDAVARDPQDDRQAQQDAHQQAMKLLGFLHQPTIENQPADEKLVQS